MANEKKKITQLPTAPQVEDNDYLPIDNTSTPTAENTGGTRKILVKDITAKSADAIDYDNTTSGLEADNVQDAIDEVLEEGGKVQDVYENGESVVDPTDKIARIHGHKEVTQAQYNALPSSKLTDGILYCIKDANFSAEDVPYDNSDSGLESENVQSAIDEIADVLGALKVEGTVENQSIATFTDGSNLPMPKLEVAVEPQQDLHGYDAPWVGGAGKNKLPMTVDGIKGANTSGTWSGNVYTYNGGTFEILVDSDNNVIGIKFNTTTNITHLFNLYSGDLSAFSNMIMNGAIDGNNGKFIRLNVGSTNYDDRGTGVNIGTVSGNGSIYIALYNQQSGTFQPMIRLATENDPTFVPYSNECPISGWSAVDVTRCGKNLVNWKWNTFNDGKMEIFLKGGTYTLSAESALTNGNAYIRGIKPSGEYCTKQELGLSNWNNSSISGVYYGGGGEQTYTFSVPNSGAVIEFGKLNTNGTISAQLEVGSTATTYEPYNGNTYTIDLDGTRYGGELRIINGVAEFVADRKYLTIDDFNSASAGTSAGGLHWFDANYKPAGKSGNKNICSICAYVQNGWASTITVMSVGISATIPVRIYDSSESLSDFKNKYPNIQVVYELATPTTIQLTPTQVNSLLGVNNIWADCGKINKAVYIRDLNIVINNLLNA